MAGLQAPIFACRPPYAWHLCPVPSKPIGFCLPTAGGDCHFPHILRSCPQLTAPGSELHSPNPAAPHPPSHLRVFLVPLKAWPTPTGAVTVPFCLEDSPDLPLPRLLRLHGHQSQTSRKHSPASQQFLPATVNFSSLQVGGSSGPHGTTSCPALSSCKLASGHLWPRKLPQVAHPRIWQTGDVKNAEARPLVVFTK